MKYFCGLLILLVPTSLWAEEGIFITPMHRSEINLIDAALRGRGWDILESNTDQVHAEASNVGRGVEAEITIFYRDGGFMYKGSAVKKTMKPGFSGNTPTVKRRPTEIPDKWLRLLRKDVGRAQASTQHHSGGAAKPDFASRLEKLKSLYDKGLISESEYHNKRSAILSEI